MSYQLKKLGIVRNGQPGLVAVAVVGLAVALAGLKMQKLAVLGVGGLLYSAAILAMIQPVLSVLLSIFGVGGGVLTFFLMPTQDMQYQPFSTKLLATILFCILYLALMDTLLLLAAFLYNALVDNMGMSGIRLELVSDEEADEEVPAQEANA